MAAPHFTTCSTEEILTATMYVMFGICSLFRRGRCKAGEQP